MQVWSEIVKFFGEDSAQKGAIAAVSAVAGWLGTRFTAWWQSRDRYHAHIGWKTLQTMYDPDDYPVLTVLNIHNVPISITRVRVWNGFGWNSGIWPFDGEDPDYPELPRTVEPMKETMLVLNHRGLEKAAKQADFLKWFGLPRVYIGVETMGRGERLFVAERGLTWKSRFGRYKY